MRTKKIISATLKEATEKMKREMGEEAIILSTRLVENNGTKKHFEVICGIEDEQNELETLIKNARKENPEAFGKTTFKDSLAAFGAKKNNPIASAKKNNSLIMKDDLQTVINTLKTREVNKDIIKLVINYLKKSKDFLTSDNLDNYVITSLASLINTVDFGIDKRQSGKIISIVGPTGVGKTTCIAKLAAISKIIHNLDIGIISIDTYRLGAIDQLRIFSEISNVDMLVAYEASDMPKLIKKLEKKDLIFIDTTGRSQRNTSELEKMKLFFKDIRVDEIYLALSLTSSLKTLMDTVEKFEIFDYDSFLFTKVDEAVTHGNMLNLTVKYQKPIIYLTNGQIIPDDIISADPDYIAKMIYYGGND